MNPTEHSLQALPYCRDGLDYAARLADLEGFVFLDSRNRRLGAGQYDIITALPAARVCLAADDASGAAWMAEVAELVSTDLLPKDSKIVRSKLAIGFIDYDSAAAWSGVSGEVLQRANAGIYLCHILQDHVRREAWLITDPDCPPETRQVLSARLSAPAPAPAEFALTAPFEPGTSRADYLANIARIRDYIAAGDCYQVNYAQRFSTRFTGDSFTAYRTLRDIAPGDFSAFLRLGDEHSVLSLSPERFLTVEAGQVKTQPIKGTRPRSPDPREDARIAEALCHSGKDRAENIMITDLLRNDLGRYCRAGSVRAPELCALQSYDNVHHLVSLVEGELAPSVEPGALLMGCSPGGSITGAPKRRAMEIIQELEQHPRGAYCGSVFALSADGWLQSSIAIRTFETLNKDIHCWGGGGIVYESDPAAEYQETIDKIGGFIRGLEDQYVGNSM